MKRAATLCRDTPTIGAGYELQGLAEVHCYRKTTHNFTPDEVEELLRFAAPLEVEEKLHRYSFPICELLKQIKAVERFPLADSTVEPYPQKRSVQEHLRTAMEDARRNAPSQGRSHSGDARKKRLEESL